MPDKKLFVSFLLTATVSFALNGQIGENAAGLAKSF